MCAFVCVFIVPGPDDYSMHVYVHVCVCVCTCVCVCVCVCVFSGNCYCTGMHGSHLDGKFTVKLSSLYLLVTAIYNSWRSH